MTEKPKPKPKPKPELRLALAMRGGVSLAVWIGGACVEIDELRRCPESGGAPFWKALMERSPYGRVVVDVMAGASAGGMNAVLFAAALRHGFRMADLQEIWLEVASVDKLRREGPSGLSLFDGDQHFLDVVASELHRLVPANTDEAGAQPYIDLHLATTHMEPLRTPAAALEDETVNRQRSAATFHFRHDVQAGFPRRDLEKVAFDQLATAARATSSFPVAFEAAIVRSTRPAVFGEPTPLLAGRLIDCRGVFSDSRGAAVPPRGTEIADPDDFVVADGGLLDNIPIARALEAILDAPARGVTERVLVYLHPTGPPPPATPTSPGDGPDTTLTPEQLADNRRDVIAVGKGVLAAKAQAEGIAGDLDQIDQLNRAIRVGRLIRNVTKSDLATQSVSDAVHQQWPSYRVQRPASDVASLRMLLDDPIGMLGEDPFPMVEQGRWAAPLVAWDAQSRLQFDVELAVRFRGQLSGTSGPQVLATGIAPLRRVIGLLLEWVRALDSPADLVATAKSRLYELASVVSMLERIRQLAWVTSAVSMTPAWPGQAGLWCEDTLTWVDGFLRLPQQRVDELLGGGVGPTGYLAMAYARLNAMLADLAPEQAPGGVDVREGIATELAELVDGLLAGRAALNDAEGSATLLHQVLTSDGPTVERLAALEVLCLAEDMNGAPGRNPVRFVRFSAAAETPFAIEFASLHEASEAIGARAPDAWTSRASFLRPEVKLAGNEVGNFSAFLKREWRENDWMWGRLDSVAGLVGVLTAPLGAADDPAPPDLCELTNLPSGATLGDVNQALVRQRQAQVLEERFGAGWAGHLAGYRTGLETITRPGSRQLRRTVLRTVWRLRPIAARTPIMHLPVPKRTAFLLAYAYLWRKLRPRG